MKKNANSVRVGNVLEYQGNLWRVLKTQHTMPGKGGAFVQMELKSLDGTKLNERFRSSEDLEVAHLEEKEYMFSYEEGDNLVLMDKETYEELRIPKDLLDEQAVFLQDQMDITVDFHESTPIGASVPDTVILEITEAEPVVKGQTAANSNKPAVLENGLRIMVPPFISAGEKVVVKTSTQEYVERAKEA